MSDIVEEIKQYLREEIKRQEGNWNTDDHSGTVSLILEEVEEIEARHKSKGDN